MIHHSYPIFILRVVYFFLLHHRHNSAVVRQNVVSSITIIASHPIPSRCVVEAGVAIKTGDELEALKIIPIHKLKPLPFGNAQAVCD